MKRSRVGGINMLGNVDSPCMGKFVQKIYHIASVMIPGFGQSDLQVAQPNTYIAGPELLMSGRIGQCHSEKSICLHQHQHVKPAI